MVNLPENGWSTLKKNIGFTTNLKSANSRFQPSISLNTFLEHGSRKDFKCKKINLNKKYVF